MPSNLFGDVLWMNFTFLWSNEAMGGDLGHRTSCFPFFEIKGEIWTVFLFSLRWKDWRFLPISCQKWWKALASLAKEVEHPSQGGETGDSSTGAEAWMMDGWMDGMYHQDSCASCRFHVLRVGSLWSQYSSTVGWRYFKEMVLSFGMTFSKYYSQNRNVLSSDAFQLQPFWKALSHLSHLSQDRSFWSTTNFPFRHETLQQFLPRQGTMDLVAWSKIDDEGEGEDDLIPLMEFLSKKKCGQQTTISILNLWKLRRPQKFAFMFHKSLILGIWKQSLFAKRVSVSKKDHFFWIPALHFFWKIGWAQDPLMNDPILFFFAGSLASCNGWTDSLETGRITTCSPYSLHFCQGRISQFSKLIII